MTAPEAVRRAIAIRYISGESSASLGTEVGFSGNAVLRWVRSFGGTVRSRKEALAARLPSADQRFNGRYEVLPNGCWRWLGRLHRLGYGMFDAPKNEFAHRYSYRRYRGNIGEALELDHLCRNRWCVNPEHLEAVTHVENCRRAVSYLGSLTHCKHGHEFTAQNTYLYRGKRCCKTCKIERQRRGRSKAKSADATYGAIAA